MFGSSSVRYGLFSVRVKFRSTILDVSLGRILVRSVWVIQVGSLLLATSTLTFFDNFILHVESLD